MFCHSGSSPDSGIHQIYMHIEWKEKNVILHIFMYNVMSNFSGARRVSKGRVKIFAA